MSYCSKKNRASPDALRDKVLLRWSGVSLRSNSPRTSTASLRAAEHPGQRQLGRRAVLLGSFAALGGCGFRPLYGGGGDVGAGRLFESVRVEREQGEAGFRMHEALVQRLRPVAGAAPLVLTTRTRLVRNSLAIEEDDQVTRFNLLVITGYALRRVGGAPSDLPLTKGEVRSIAAYNATASQYATLVAERQGVRRASEEIADKIVKRLAVAYDPAWGA